MKKLKASLNYLCKKIEKLYPDFRISDLGVDLAIDRDMNLHLIEINVNKPGVLNHEFTVAQLAIPYCISLAKESKVEAKSNK